MSKTDDTLPTLRLLVKHAGLGMLPPGLYFTASGIRWGEAFLDHSTTRDLCSGSWERMLGRVLRPDFAVTTTFHKQSVWWKAGAIVPPHWGHQTSGEYEADGPDPFSALAALILALPPDVAKRCFAKEKS